MAYCQIRLMLHRLSCLFLIGILLISCSSEEHEIKLVKSCRVCVLEGRDCVDHLTVYALSQDLSDSIILFKGGRYPSPLKVNDIDSLTILEFNNYAKDLEIIFRISNDADSTRKVKMEVTIYDSNDNLYRRKIVGKELEACTSIIGKIKME